MTAAPVTVRPAAPRAEPAAAAPQSPPGIPRTEVAGWAVLVVGLALWLVSLGRLRSAPVSEYGLVAAGGPLFPLAVLAVAAAFGLAVRASATRLAVVCLVGFVAVTRATASIVTPLPLFTWTFKHIGVVDHISQTGSLARSVDIYNNWPGFFAVGAWFSDATGLPFDDVAKWFPVVADLALVAGMYALSRAFGQSMQVALVAAFGLQALNWVGQDYYSPQATAFVLALPTLALLLRSRTEPRAAWLTVPLFAAITIVHQLTPFWIAGVAILLGVTNRIRPHWIFGVYLLIAIGFLLLNFSSVRSYGLLSGFDPLSNAQSNVPTRGNAGRAFTSLAARGTSVIMWLAAVLAAWRARRRREPVWVPAVLAFGSFALLAGQNYGGEAIFRVFLYSMPGCLLLIAPIVTAAVTTRPAPVRPLAVLGRMAVVAVTVLALLGSLQANYGTWFVNVVSRDGLAEQERLLATVPTDAYLIGLATGIAERPTGRYVDFALNHRNYDALLVVADPGVIGTDFTPSQIGRLTTLLQSYREPIYLIVTEQMRRFCTYYGLFPPGAVDNLVHGLARSGRWDTITDTATLSVFRLGAS